MDWFRFYHDALDDPKVQRLEPWLFKQWVNLLCLASKGEPRGVLPPVPDIEFRLRLSTEETLRAVGGLIRAGLIDELVVDGIERLGMHNWHNRQRRSDDVALRVQKHRDAKKQGESLHVTLHGDDEKRYGNALEKNRVEKEKTTPLPPKARNGAAAEGESPPSQDFDSFIPTYCKTLGKTLEKAVGSFRALDPTITEGWIKTALVEAERQAGPLPRDKLQAGLHVAYAGLERAIAAERDGGKKIGSVRGLSRSVIIESLKEQADVHVA